MFDILHKFTKFKRNRQSDSRKRNLESSDPVPYTSKDWFYRPVSSSYSSGIVTDWKGGVAL